MAIWMCVAFLSGCGARDGSDRSAIGLPVHPDTELLARVSPSETESAREEWFLAGGDPSTIREWYRAEMPDAGWQAASEAEESIVLYRDGRGCYALVSVYEVIEPRPGVIVDLTRLPSESEDLDCDTPPDDGPAADATDPTGGGTPRSIDPVDDAGS